MSLLKFAALAVVLAIPVAIAQANGGIYVPPPFQGTVGQLEIRNDSAYPVTITLWHPNSGQIWHRYVLPPNSTDVARNVGGQLAFLGDDWGLQIGNSPIKPLSRCARFQNFPPQGAFFNTSTDEFATR